MDCGDHCPTGRDGVREHEAEARQKAAALAFWVIAERLEHGEPVPDEARSLFALA